MNTTRQTAATKGDKRPSVTPVKLIRWAGLAAMAAGIYFAVIQPIHPPDVVASVTTGEWAIITSLKTVMCLLFLFGIAGIYFRQVEEAGWLGLAGYLVFSVSWWVQTAFVFAEAFILPVLATAEPKFVDGMLGIGAGRASEVNLGALPVLYNLLVSIPYLLGGLLLGIATYRARILPRWPAVLLAVTALVTPAAALLRHAQQRLVAIPMGLAVAWLGFALLTERRGPAPDPCADREGSLDPQLEAA